MKVVILGSSCAIPTKERNLPSAALEYNGDVYLFDCGEGTQRELIKNNISISKIKKIFISHLHADHFIGLAGLLRTISMLNLNNNIEIFSPDSAFLEKFLDLSGVKTNAKIKRIKEGVIVDEPGFEVSAFRLKHSVTAYGFVFKEKDRVKFFKDKAKNAGLKGEMFKEILEKGKIKVNGKIVKLKEISYIKPGKKVAYVTDTAYYESVVKSIKNADLLIHESTYSTENKDLADARFHSTAKDAAMIAKKGNVKLLVLFHISNRYKDEKLLEKEAKKYFKNSIAAYDGLSLEV